MNFSCLLSQIPLLYSLFVKQRTIRLHRRILASHYRPLVSKDHARETTFGIHPKEHREAFQ